LTPPEISHGSRQYRDGEPVFREQWHAEVIAVVELLVAAGRLNPRDWSETLGAELDKRSHNGEPDDESTYYETFLAALESVLNRDGFASYSEVDRRENDWRLAYLNTPHGQPVELSG
jgi:nitrile hydratase accessory protein